MRALRLRAYEEVEGTRQWPWTLNPDRSFCVPPKAGGNPLPDWRAVENLGPSCGVSSKGRLQGCMRDNCNRGLHSTRCYMDNYIVEFYSKIRVQYRGREDWKRVCEVWFSRITQRNHGRFSRFYTATLRFCYLWGTGVQSNYR